VIGQDGSQSYLRLDSENFSMAISPEDSQIVHDLLHSNPRVLEYVMAILTVCEVDKNNQLSEIEVKTFCIAIGYILNNLISDVIEEKV